MTAIAWEDTGMFPDFAFAGLGDANLVGDRGWLKLGLPCLFVRPRGLGLVYGKCECDGLPFEIGRTRSEIRGRGTRVHA